jgi:hypothetical protein
MPNEKHERRTSFFSQNPLTHGANGGYTSFVIINSIIAERISMYGKIFLGFLLGFQLLTQPAAAAVINVYPAGPGRLQRAEAPLVSLTPTLWWAPVPGIDSYKIEVMEFTANETFRLAHSQTGIAGVSKKIGTSQWLTYCLPTGALNPKKTYFWVIKPSKPELQATNFTAMYFRTGVANPSPGTAGNPGPVLSTLTPLLEWPVLPNGTNYQLGIFHILGYNPDPTKPSYENPAVLRQGTSDSSLTVPVGILKPGSRYMWTAGPSFQYYFQTPAEPFRSGLQNEVKLVVGKGIGFKVIGGFKPYAISEENSDIVRSFRQSKDEGSEDFQINALSPGTTHVVISDKSDTNQHIRVTIVVAPK